MFEFMKKSSKTILIIILFINLILFLSFLFELLISINILSNSLIILTFPIKILSEKIIFVILLLLFDSFTIGFIWFFFRKKIRNKIDSGNDIVEFDFLLDNNEKKSTNLHDLQIIDITNKENRNYSEKEIDTLRLNTTNQNIEQTLETIQDENIIPFDEEEDDFSPSFLAIDNLKEKSNEKEFYQTDIKDRITDYQFALYQNIVNNEWLYEIKGDRERIGFCNNAISESNISLSDLNKLIKMGLIYKKNISHPSGSFTVYSSNLKIEKEIINSIIRRICRKNRNKPIARKIDFPNWKELGIAERFWQFDIELPHKALLGIILIDDAFIKNNSKLNLKQESKEKIKALFAAIYLKLKVEGTALIVTNSIENCNVIDKFVKSTGWGNAKILDFSSSNFYTKFDSVIK